MGYGRGCGSSRDDAPHLTPFARKREPIGSAKQLGGLRHWMNGRLPSSVGVRKRLSAYPLFA